MYKSFYFVYKKGKMIDNSKLTITDADVAKLEKKFVTKKAFKSELLKMRQEFTKKFNEIMNRMDEDRKVNNGRFDAIMVKMDEDRNIYTTRFDAVMGELKASSEDRTIAAYQISDSRKKIKNHESRIVSIEEKIAF